MPPWSDDLSNLTLDEVSVMRKENRSWYRELQRKINTLADSKLSKEISSEVYASKRTVLSEAIAEYKRRARILANEISVWGRGARSRAKLVK